MSSRLTITLVLIATLGLACEEPEDSYQRKLCDPVAGALIPASGSPDGGYEVLLDGRFISSSFEAFAVHDVVIRFGGSDAEVLSVDTAGCGACDDCLVAAEICLDCWDVCNGDEAYEEQTQSCVEEIVAVVPPGEPGEVVVSLFNGHGATQDYRFTYLGWCEDGVDNDGDGAVDDDDPGCTGTGGDGEAGPCENGLDDDGDGWTDLDDPGCGGDMAGADEGGTGDTACNNGLDDDGDGWIDGEDLDCDDALDDDETTPPSGCENALDDDGDGWIDADDPDCTDPANEEAGLGTTACNNGLDDDGDGDTDQEDDGCDDGFDDDESQ